MMIKKRTYSLIKKLCLFLWLTYEFLKKNKNMKKLQLELVYVLGILLLNLSWFV